MHVRPSHISSGIAPNPPLLHPSCSLSCGMGDFRSPMDSDAGTGCTAPTRPPKPFRLSEPCAGAPSTTPRCPGASCLPASGAARSVRRPRRDGPRQRLRDEALHRHHWHPDLPYAFRDPALLGFLAAQLAWQEGRPPPRMPAGLTSETLEALLDRLSDPRIRRAVVRELSVPTPHRADLAS